MLLRKGDQGQRVRTMQEKLREKGYDPGPVDGVFGFRTERAVLAFQEDHGLAVDGLVGPATWQDLCGTRPEPLIAELSAPPVYEECFDIFGDFRLAGWQQHELVRCDLAAHRPALEHLRFSWLPDGGPAMAHHDWFGFLCHRLVAPHFQAVFAELATSGLADRLATFDGCFNVRAIRGGTAWSTHSWGIAVDLDADGNRFGRRDFTMDPEVAACFEAHGFVWGGRWQRPDAMHFQYCLVR